MAELQADNRAELRGSYFASKKARSTLWSKGHLSDFLSGRLRRPLGSPRINDHKKDEEIYLRNKMKALKRKYYERQTYHVGRPASSETDAGKYTLPSGMATFLQMQHLKNETMAEPMKTNELEKPNNT
ncbi:MAG: hypothetical protein [Microvirus sp.]|nr:MAG: hypothetical protein [Microvirus sp.]